MAALADLRPQVCGADGIVAPKTQITLNKSQLGPSHVNAGQARRNVFSASHGGAPPDAIFATNRADLTLIAFGAIAPHQQ